MRDRVPTPGKENRVRITFDDGSFMEGVLSYADDAVQEGSAYIKGNVLPDSVCDALQLDRSLSEPKDAFMALQNYTDSQLDKRLETTFQKLVTGRLI